VTRPIGRYAAVERLSDRSFSWRLGVLAALLIVRGSACAAMVALGACNVASPPRSTGGVSFDAGSSPDGGSAPDGAATSNCETGVVIVTSDYKSTNIAVSRLDGTTLSGSFVSSGATRPGLALALSGDVDVPLVAPASGRLLLIDRYGTNVLTWMNVADATVIAQLPVGTGFQSNPHDYVEIDATHAYVSRFGTNPNPGQQTFDQGGDVLIVDTKAPALVGRIAIPEENPALQPCPDLMTWIGREVVLTLGRWSADFSQVGDGRFVGLSPSSHAIDWTVNVTGLQSCGRVALSPSGSIAAIACSSSENMTTHQFDPTLSDIVVYDATQTPPKEVRRLGLGMKLGAGIQPAIAFASEDALVATTYGGNATPGDSVFAVSVTTGDVTALGQSTMPYVLGGLHCAPGCGDVCLLSDAESNKLRRWRLTSGTFTPLDDATVDTVVGLPPRDIGGLR
jgi:hypothetical protein